MSDHDPRPERSGDSSTVHQEVDDELELAESSQPQEQIQSGEYTGDADPSLTEGYEADLRNLRDAAKSAGKADSGDDHR